MIKFPFNEIEGLLSANDKVALRDLASQCRHLSGVYVEIGSYKGASAACIAAGFDFNRAIFAFDYFEDGKFEEFIGNMDAAGVVTAPFRGDFRDTLKLKEICFCLIDHSHTLKDTQDAVEMVWPRLVKNGLMLIHDYQHEDYLPATEYIDTLPFKRVPLEGTGFIVFKKDSTTAP